MAKYCSDPNTVHWMAVKRIFRYLKGTQTYGLEYRHGIDEKMHGYADADWAGDTDDRKSVSGFVFMLSGTAISWRSKKQTTVALSTAEAEYVSLAAAAQEAIWLRLLLKTLGQDTANVIKIYEDNNSAICIAKNPVTHARTKHIDIKYHFIRDQIDRQVLEVDYCCTQEMVADILTKPLAKDQFEKLRERLGMKKLLNTEKEC